LIGWVSVRFGPPQTDQPCSRPGTVEQGAKALATRQGSKNVKKGKAKNGNGPLAGVKDYRYEATKRKNIPPAKIAAEGVVPLMPKVEYSYSPRRPPKLQFDPTGGLDQLPELLATARQRALNEDEAKALFEVEDFEGVLAGAKKWGGIAALTRSAKGCVIVEESTMHEIPAAPVSRVIDTTGAGDQFAAGFLYGMTHGKGLADCGRLGALAAAEVISHYGARPETPLKELAAKAGLV